MSSTLSSLRSSPIPDLAYDSYRSLSLRDQTLVKRQLLQQQQNLLGPGDPSSLSSPSQNSTYNRNIGRANRDNSGTLTKSDTQQQQQFTPSSLLDPHNPNYVVANGKTYSLTKYGGQSVTFWILLAILAILAVINALLTFIIFGVLRLGAGMESMEFLPKVLKFYGLADLDEIFKRDGLLESLPGQPMEFTGDDGSLRFVTPFGNQPSLTIDQNIINISQVSEFKVSDQRGREVFSTNTPTLGLPKGMKSLDVRLVKANRVTSGLNVTLTMRSHTFAYMKGSEGTHMKGKSVTLFADQDIFLKSVNGNIILMGKEGLVLDVNALPLVKEDSVTRNSHTITTEGRRESQYQLCVCMPEGRLFKVPIPLNNPTLAPEKRIGCHSTVNPCNSN